MDIKTAEELEELSTEEKEAYLNAFFPPYEYKSPYTKPRPKDTRNLIGYVDVDSGQLMVGDPCYIKPNWSDDVGSASQSDEDGPFPHSYEGACMATLSYKSAGSLHHEMGHSGAAVAFSSGYGDGSYPIYATYNSDGRIVKVEILMDEFEEEDVID